jgi:outer membrane protein assembly factor BamB
MKDEERDTMNPNHQRSASRIQCALPRGVEACFSLHPSSFILLALLLLPQAAGAADWPMWGGAPQRNMVNTAEKNIPSTWDVTTGKNVKWIAQLGSQTYGNPVVAGGHVYVGTNNQAERQPQAKGDKGVVMCFRESDGKFLWQIARDKLAAGRVNDWPKQGICSTSCVDGNHVYFVSNRCEVICADVDGTPGSNDGRFAWKLDMIKELGVFPHNMSASSPAIDGDLLFLVTGNGVDESHIVIPAPDAPDFIAVNKNTGAVVWDRNDPGEKIMHGQWSSPVVGVMGGRKQVVFPGGDGRLYSFDPATGKPFWSFQGNPEGTVYKLGGLGTRNEIIATPVVYGDRVYFSLGQDPEHGEGPSHLYAIDGTKDGDITKTGIVWHNTEVNRAMSTVAIHDGVLYHCDLSGVFRAIDPETGKVLWRHDMGAAVWSSPYYVDGKVFMGNEDGDLLVFAAGKEKKLLNTVNLHGSVYTTPVAANGALFVTTREKLYAIQEGASCDPKKVN